MSEHEPRVNRREFNLMVVKTLALASLFESVNAAEAFSKGYTEESRRWLVELYDICNHVKDGSMSATEWQDQMARHYKSQDVDTIVKLVDYKRLIGRMKLPDNMATFKNVTFDKSLKLPADVRMGKKIIAMSKGRCIVPHAHNNMVSAHFILKGQFHVRTFDRVSDADGCLRLVPSIDSQMGPGNLVTMSDDRDNVHWFVAQAEPSCTFDVTVTDLLPQKKYGVQAEFMSMIYVDPTESKSIDGVIPARVIGWEEALDKFGKLT